MSAEAFFDAYRAQKRELTGDLSAVLTQADVDAANAIFAAWKPPAVAATELTPRIVLEIAGHEAIVQEAYKDGGGVWTWAMGVTNASGHEVYPRYKDNPQSLAKCLAVSIWLLQRKYLPDVLTAFAGQSLTEAQLAAALSFHYNTGAILHASWVTAWKQGATATARAAIMEWKKPASIIGRRTKERDLFFDDHWSNDGKTIIYGVSKPSYAPDWGSAHRVDISADVQSILAGAA